MLRISLIAALATASVFAALLFATTSPASPAHRNTCHTRHTCPSDHATYRWRGWLCVKPTSDKRNASFRKRIRHLGRTYYCKK